MAKGSDRSGKGVSSLPLVATLLVLSGEVGCGGRGGDMCLFTGCLAC
ncbi:MAG: hypothetical protein Q9M13_01575 [Mariprofundales bacterium]|nr:hypothetical protein [Mariprofundales bacterium]